MTAISKNEPLNLEELGLTGQGIKDVPDNVSQLVEGRCFDYEVKSWTWLFEALLSGVKKHDMRDKRDRPYRVGDIMLMREFDQINGTYTGRSIRARISYITDNVTPYAMSSAALDRNFAILSLDILSTDLGE